MIFNISLSRGGNPELGNCGKGVIQIIQVARFTWIVDKTGYNFPFRSLILGIHFELRIGHSSIDEFCKPLLAAIMVSHKQVRTF